MHQNNRLSSRFILLFAAGMLLLNGCAFQPRQTIFPEYKNKREFSASVLAMPISNFFIPPEMRSTLTKGKEFQIKPVGKMERDYFNHYFGPALSEISTANVIGIDPDFKPETMKFSYVDLWPGKKSKLNMFVPTKGKITYKEQTPKYVIFFEDLYFEKTSRTTGGSLGQGSSDNFVMRAGLEYLIWDNVKEKIAGFGVVEEKKYFMEIPTKTDYIALFDKFALTIIENSPMARRY